MEVTMLCAFCSCGSLSENPSPDDTTAPQTHPHGGGADAPNSQEPQRNSNNNNNYVAMTTNPTPLNLDPAASRSSGQRSPQISSSSLRNTSSTAKNCSVGASSKMSSVAVVNPSCKNLPAQVNATHAELEQWKRSFDLLMSTTRGQDSFRQFLRSEYSEENMLFWLSCEELKELKDSNQISAKCKQIYEEYISVLSPKEVSIDSRIREIINRNMTDPNTTTFEDAQNQIYQLMKRDSYHRFINSPYFKSLEDHAKGNAPTSSSGGSFRSSKTTTICATGVSPGNNQSAANNTSTNGSSKPSANSNSGN